MFIFHILVYFLFGWGMYSLAEKSQLYEPEENKIDKYLWGYIIFFTLICALRGRTGVDTLSYVHSFKNGYIDEEWVNGEWGFYYLVNFIANNHLHFSIGLGICAFTQIYFIVKGALPYKYILVIFPIILFGNSLFLSLTNAMRQMMAAAVFFYAIKFIVERKWYIYMGLIIAASLVHHSALLLLPLYFIPSTFKIYNKRILLLGIYIICFIVGSTPQFQNLIIYLEQITSSVGYDNYVEAASEILNEGYTSEAKAFGPMQLSYFLCGLAVIWYGPMIGEECSERIPTFNLWYLFAVAYGCLYFLVCNVSHLMIRPIMYFQIVQAIVLSLIIYELIQREDRKTAAILIIVACTATAWDIIKASNAPFECVTYKLFFL